MANPISLLPGEYFHIFNRGNNRENIFFQEPNFSYFLQLWANHIEPVAETYTYCLLPNHFHFLVRLKEARPGKPSQSFSNLFNAYSRTINTTYHRTGALFQRPFGRIRIDSDQYLLCLIAYIHQNPQKHELISDFRDWPYSSYQAMLSTRSTHLMRAEVLALFGGVESFVDFHQTIPDLTGLNITLVNSDDQEE